MPFDNPYFGPDNLELHTLRAARRLIDEPQKWLKAKYVNYDRNKHCAVAALATACGNRLLQHPTQLERKLRRMLAHEIPLRHRWMTSVFTAKAKIILYNDRPLTSHRDLVAVFDLAIERLELRTIEAHR